MLFYHSSNINRSLRWWPIVNGVIWLGMFVRIIGRERYGASRQRRCNGPKDWCSMWHTFWHGPCKQDIERVWIEILLITLVHRKDFENSELRLLDLNFQGYWWSVGMDPTDHEKNIEVTMRYLHVLGKIRIRWAFGKWREGDWTDLMNLRDLGWWVRSHRRNDIYPRENGSLNSG